MKLASINEGCSPEGDESGEGERKADVLGALPSPLLELTSLLLPGPFVNTAI